MQILSGSYILSKHCKGESLVEIKSSPEGERDERDKRDAAMVNLTTSAVALHVLSVGCTVTRQ